MLVLGLTMFSSVGTMDVRKGLIVLAMKKYSVAMDADLIERIEQYAAKYHITRNAAFSLLITQALDAQKALGTLEELMQVYKLEAAKKALSESSQSEQPSA